MRRDRYADRVEAGRVLAESLGRFIGKDPVVVGLPRGGVVVAAEVSRALGGDLDVIIAGKLRAPQNPELAIGAITEEGAAYVNKDVLGYMRITEEYLEEEKKRRLEVIRERLKSYRGVKPKVPLAGRTVIVVDDGLATGSTMISAVQAAHASGAGEIVVAVPGGPPDTVERISEMEEVSEVVCPLMPRMFFAVSQLYEDFHQIEDSEVMDILREFAR